MNADLQGKNTENGFSDSAAPFACWEYDTAGVALTSFTEIN